MLAAPSDAARSDAASGDGVVELQRRIVEFVRAFGLHRQDETPCGAAMSVSAAHALTIVAEQGAMTQTSLSARLELTKSTVSRLVDDLVQRGWVRRRNGEVDARQRLVELTPSGSRTVEEIGERRTRKMAALLAHIPISERSAVLAALDRLVAASREA